MKLVISRDSLVEAIAIVQKAVSTRSTLPILDGILIEASSKGVKLTGYDLETGIEALVEADVMEEGSIVIPSKVFGEIIRKLPDEEVAISSNERMVIDIESGTSKFSINGISAEGFPTIPVVGDDNKIILNQEILRDMISQTIFAISTDEGRPILNGSLFESDGKNINVVSIDGFRMAHRKKEIGEDLPVMKFLIPGKALHEAARILTGKAVFSVVSGSLEDLCHRLYGRSQIGTSAVVLKSIEDTASLDAFLLQEVRFVCGVLNISDILADRVDIDRAEALDLRAVMLLIVITEHLVTAADAEEYHAVLDRFFHLRTLHFDKVLTDHVLLGILSAA